MSKQLNIACYNARGIMPSALYVEKLLDKYDIDILGICEHWLFPNMLSFIDSLHMDYCGFGVSSATLDLLTSHHRGQGGIAFIYKRSLQCRITALDIDDDRICGISVSMDSNFVLNVIMVYLPPSNYAINEYKDYIERLYDLHSIYLTDSSDLVLMGDFNCEVPGEKCSRLTKSRGIILKQFIDDVNYVSVNNSTNCTGPSFTFQPEVDETRTTLIDHILIEKDNVHKVSKCAIIDDVENCSDHLPIYVSINMSIYHEKTMCPKKRLKWNKYTNENICKRYTENVEMALNELPDPDENVKCMADVESYYESIVNILKDTAETHIGYKAFNAAKKPYWNPTINDMHKNMVDRRKEWLNDGSRDKTLASFSVYKNAKKIFRNEFRKAKIDWEKQEYDDIEQTAEIDQKSFWHLIKKKRQKGPQKEYAMMFEGKRCIHARDIADGWATYFQNLYTPLEKAGFDEQFKQEMEAILCRLMDDKVGFNEVLDGDINDGELKDAINQLKMGKAGGHDLLTNEHIVYGGETLIQHLCKLYSLMLKYENVPSNMLIGLMITLLKPDKKDKSNPDNHRGITLLPVLYKLFEKTTLVRMYTYLKTRGIRFPDPSQTAYQELLSSLNATFSIQETVKYNVERGSKVFVCLMDNVKAFDVVWHTGLFIRLHELGICNKLWRVIINAYRNMKSAVLYKGIISRLFNILQSSRQGSMWGTLFYLTLIDPLLSEIKCSGEGAHVGNLYSGIHAQADDVALIATSKSSLQAMMNICYRFSTLWRFVIHPQKSKIIVWGESTKWNAANSKQRKWLIGNDEVEEVAANKHCGVILTSSLSTIERTKLACRKGRSVTNAWCNQAALGQGKLNPITSLKLYKTITLPSALYGCELWTQLSCNEKLMLERMQRYCCKIIQGLGRQTRSDICTRMLGLQSIESYMDAAKMKFYRRLAAIPSDCISKEILLRRLYQNELIPCTNSGFADELNSIMKKYGLTWAIGNFLSEGIIPDKHPWKKIVSVVVQNKDCEQFYERTREDTDFYRFHHIHPDISKPSPVWRVARDYPYMLDICLKVAQIIATPPKDEELLCEYCGCIFKDWVVHYACHCSHTQEEQEYFWNIIDNHAEINLTVFLYNIEDSDFVNILLGGPCHLFDNVQCHSEFLKISLNFITRILDKTPYIA